MKNITEIMAEITASKGEVKKAGAGLPLPEKQHVQAALKAEAATEAMGGVVALGYAPATFRFDRKAIAHVTLAVPRTLEDRITAHAAAVAAHKERMAARKLANTPEAKAKAAEAAKAKRAAMTPEEKALELAKHNAKQMAKTVRAAKKALAEAKEAAAKAAELAA